MRNMFVFIRKRMTARFLFGGGVLLLLLLSVSFQQTNNVYYRILSRDLTRDSDKICTCNNSYPQADKKNNSFTAAEVANTDQRSFKEVVTSRVRHDGVIITPAVIDKGYLDMARNLYITSIVPHNLTAHTLFLCVDREACDAAAAHGLPTFLFKDYNKENTGDFGSSVFKQKAMMKHYMIYDILKMGFKVFLTDLDLYWFKNPVDQVIKACGNRDFAIQKEADIELNIGFMFVRPTQRSLAFFKKVIVQAEKVGGQGAQRMFNQMVITHRGHISYQRLTLQLFPDGLTYFEKMGRAFPERNPCKSCYICHNNWIVGTEAKTYRFREHQMWMVDEGYYSNRDARYMVYSNPIKEGNNLTTNEVAALRSALAIGEILGRIVIVPHIFHNTSRHWYPMNGAILIRALDAEFKDRYRESTFLSHPLVPKFDQKCGTFLINNDFVRSHKEFSVLESDVTVLFPADIARGATDAEILDWFSSYKTCQVMTFHSLYGAFKGYVNEGKNAEMERKFNTGLVRGKYRQLEHLWKKNTTTSTTVKKQTIT